MCIFYLMKQTLVIVTLKDSFMFDLPCHKTKKTHTFSQHYKDNEREQGFYRSRNKRQSLPAESPGYVLPLGPHSAWYVSDGSRVKEICSDAIGRLKESTFLREEQPKSKGSLLYVVQCSVCFGSLFCVGLTLGRVFTALILLATAINLFPSSPFCWRGFLAAKPRDLLCLSPPEERFLPTCRIIQSAL